ncbi:MAG: hypothetical protein GF334_04735 [Candidatus Altiarchaeales archaeon]|nr:hypothetical protein [Candidatus Altiarchaeales archaeon]
MVDWSGAILAILKAAKPQDQKVDKKYIVIKPRVLSDANYLRAINVLKATIPFIPVPGAAIAAPVLSLGTMGVKIWKRFQLGAEFEQLKYPLINPNSVHLHFSLDEELKNKYADLLDSKNWNKETIQRLERIYNDLNYITDVNMLKAKYPNLSEDYLEKRARNNAEVIQENLKELEQELIKVSHDAKVENNVREAFGSLKKLFPAMNNWALFNSRGFNEIIDIIDTVV